MIKSLGNSIIIENKSIQYVLYINEIGVVETVYFGKKLNNEINFDVIRKANQDNWATQYLDNESLEEKTYSDGYHSIYARKEISSNGLQDIKGAPIIIEQKDGTLETNFIYKNHKIIKGYPEFKYPHAHGDDSETLIITYFDEKSKLILNEYISISEKCNIIVKNFEIINQTGENHKLNRLMSMQLDLPTNKYDLHHFAGRWGDERNEKINTLVDGKQEISSLYGRSSHEENPFVFITSKNSDEVIGFNLIYSGNFKFSAFSDYMESTHILYGINDEEFSYYLKSGERFVTPQAVISYSSNGIDNMSIQFHEFIKNNIVTYKNDKDYKSILFNSWEGTMFNCSTKIIKEYAIKAKEIGSELFVLDDGWFGHRDDDYTSLGDWFEYSNKINLKEISEFVHSIRMKFGIWFEPEMISVDSNLFKKHPDYALGYGSKYLLLHRHQLYLDFSNDDVVENVYSQMCKILDDINVDYIKWDHNRVIREHKSTFLPKEQQGEVFHRNTIGYYKLFEKLIKRYPNIMFEGCASGGGRFDLGTLYYAPQIWASDISDPAQRIYIQYATSLGYPLSTIGSHVNNHWIAPYKTKALLALFGTYGFEMNPTKLTKEEITDLFSISEIYKQYHNEVIENGTLYHIFNPIESNYFSLQSVSKDLEKSLFILINKRRENVKFRYVRLKGLNPNKLYELSTGEKIYGEQLMNIGLNLSNYPLDDEYQCIFITLK